MDADVNTKIKINLKQVIHSSWFHPKSVYLNLASEYFTKSKSFYLPDLHVCANFTRMHFSRLTIFSRTSRKHPPPLIYSNVKITYSTTKASLSTIGSYIYLCNWLKLLLVLIHSKPLQCKVIKIV